MPKSCLRIAVLALGVVLGSQAYAADLPVKAAPHAMFNPAPVTTWTGFYVGGNIGYGWANADRNHPTTSGVTSETLDGIVGGGQIGYNWQTGRWVLGIEADMQGTDQKKTGSGSVLGITYSTTDKVDYFGTVRGRLGYAFGPWMPYVTGGWGYGKFESTGTILGTTSGGSVSHSAWVLGGGLEWMFAPHWSTKLEYIYFDTGSMDVGSGDTSTVHNNIVRAGVNYHF